jgi:organic hydroperoxide reductase OsmC/OhrA
MKISAHVQNSEGRHEAMVSTEGQARIIPIPPKVTGLGSSANGDELLFLALATCYCNDIYREAAQRGIQVDRVDVDVEGDFGAPGEPARNVTYHARVTAQASEQQIRELMAHTDRVAEIQNTLRVETPVVLSHTAIVVV